MCNLSDLIKKVNLKTGSDSSSVSKKRKKKVSKMF